VSVCRLSRRTKYSSTVKLCLLQTLLSSYL